MTKTPIIKCLPRPDFPGGFMFWCPFCERWHRHGLGKGERVAHCHGKQSPLNDSGYIVKMATRKELREIAKAIAEYLE